MLWVLRGIKVVLIVICFALIVLVMLQDGKEAGLGSGITGGYSQTYVGQHRSDTPEGKMERYTRILLAAFLIVALVLNILAN